MAEMNQTSPWVATVQKITLRTTIAIEVLLSNARVKNN